MTFEFPVLSLGSIAERQVANFGEGNVIAVFDKSFYLESATGIVCIAGLDQGSSPLNISVATPSAISWQASGICLGARGSIVADELRVGNGFSFPLGDATVWQPPPPPVGIDPKNVEVGLSELVKISAERGIEAGLGNFIDPAFHPDERDVVSQVASPDVARLRHWLAEEFGCLSVVSLPEVVILRHFIGLGPGLTPSGSDFLGAMMVALNALKANKLRDRFWLRLRPISQSIGNPIAAAHLAAAAEGVGAAAMHRGLNAILSAQLEVIEEITPEIDAVGHTSGWDGMAGFSLVLGAWLQMASLR